MKSRPPAHTRMKFTRRRTWRGAEWEKLDIQKVSRKVNLISVRRAIIGQQFFFFSNIFLFPPSPLSLAFSPPPCLRYRGAQLGQKLRKLVKGRICWKSGYCEWQLAVHYSWITATPGWQRGRQRQRVGGGERMEECVWGGGGEKESEGNEMDGGGTRKRAFQWKHREPCLPLSKIVIVSLGLSLDALDPEDYP